MNFNWYIYFWSLLKKLLLQPSTTFPSYAFIHSHEGLLALSVFDEHLKYILSFIPALLAPFRFRASSAVGVAWRRCFNKSIELWGRQAQRSMNGKCYGRPWFHASLPLALSLKECLWECNGCCDLNLTHSGRWFSSSFLACLSSDTNC